jgi:hypothetical protein
VLADVTAKARGKLAVIAPMAFEAVKRIDAILDVEREINGRVPLERLAERALRVGPLVADLEIWMPHRARQAVAALRSRQGHGLHAQALGCVRALPLRRPHLPHQ